MFDRSRLIFAIFYLKNDDNINKKTFEREKRETDFAIGSTPVTVGPGKYNLEIKRKKSGS